MESVLKEFFGNGYLTYSQAFEAIDVPRFLYAGHVRMLQMRSDFDMSETPDLGQHATAALANVDDAINRISTGTEKAMGLCKSVWLQVRTAKLTGSLFDEQQTMKDFAQLNAYLMEKNAFISRLAKMELKDEHQDRLLIQTIIFHAEMELSNLAFEAIMEIDAAEKYGSAVVH